MDEYVGFKIYRDLMLVLRVKANGCYFLVNMMTVKPNLSDLATKSKKPRSRAEERRPDGIVDPLSVREKSLATYPPISSSHRQ